MQEAGMDFPMPPDALPTYETLLQAIREKGKAQVEVLHSADHWFGVTYAADKPAVVAALAEKTARGEYPRNGLWEK